MSSKIEKLIVKYLTKSATSKDLDDLSEWIKKPSNKIFFKGFVQTHYVISYSMNNPDTNKMLEQLLKSIKKEKSFVYKLKNRLIYRYTAAAMIVGLLVSVYYMTNNILDKNLDDNIPILVNSDIEPGTDKAILTLEDGSLITLEKGETIRTPSASSNGEKIIYEGQKQKEFVYNYLSVPRGGQFHLILSDGTEVWLNSESRLKYPVSFIDGVDREVELIYGEAYFDVSPSLKHKGAKFKVLNKSQDIEVVGTEFNVKAYKDETNIYTTLVEGHIDVSIKNLKKSLIPNQQLILDTNTNVSKVGNIDVYNEVSWKDGVFSFDNKSLKDIMKVLSRWYDVEIVIKNKSIESEEFVGILRKNKKLDVILTGIKNFGIIKNFEINDKKVVLE